MSGFRKPRTFLTEQPGAYVAGVWVPGARGIIIAPASVQPLASGQDMEALPEGRRFSDAVKIYTTTALQTTEDGEGVQPDMIVHNGYCYEIVTRFPNQNDVIPHNKYIAVRAMKFTSEANWLSGDLGRP